MPIVRRTECSIKTDKTTFFDFFAGVGGFRLALERLGWRCVGYCEIDRACWRTYEANFDTRGEFFWHDIKTPPVQRMPDFDVLAAGVPCQAFSLAGRRGGFEDARGTLWFDIFAILKEKVPRAFLLENVKGLVCKPFRDREFKRIIEILTEELNYQTFWKVLNSKAFGVPQNRERVFIVGFRKHRREEFTWPGGTLLTKRLSDVLEEDVPERYYLSQKMVETLVRHLERHRSKGHGFGFRVHSPDGTCEALRSHGLNHTHPPIVASLKSTYHKLQGDQDFVAEGPINLTRQPHRAYRVYSPDGISPSVTSPSIGDLQPKIVAQTNPHSPMEERRIRLSDTARSLKAEWSAQQQPLVAEPFPIRFLNQNQRNFGDVAMAVDTAGSTGVMIYRHPLNYGKKSLYSTDEVYPSLRTVSRSPQGMAILHQNKSNNVGVHPEGSCALRSGASHNYITLTDGMRIRRLTPRECARLQGFPDSFVLPCSDTQSYRQLGNAVSVPVVEAIGRQIEKFMKHSFSNLFVVRNSGQEEGSRL